MDEKNQTMRFPTIMRKYLPLWVVASLSMALIVGYRTPGVASLKPAIPFLLFLMLYPMMINLRVEDISKALRDWKLLFGTVLINFLLTPVLGALWTRLFFCNADPYLAMGFILKVTVPCSGMVAAWTGYAEGKVESALIVVAVSLVLAIFLVPFWMWALAGAYVPIDPVMIFNKMLLIVVLPLAAGMVTRRALVVKYGPKQYKQRIAPYFPAISTCGMLLMIFIIIATQAELILDHFQWMFLILLGIATLYPLLFALAIGFAKAAHLDYGNGMALGYSVTAKNHAITIGLASAAFGGTLAVLPAAVAPLVQIPIMLLVLKASDGVRRILDGRSGAPGALPASKTEKGERRG